MSGESGDEGYIILNTTAETYNPVNNYYSEILSSWCEH